MYTALGPYHVVNGTYLHTETVPVYLRCLISDTTKQMEIIVFCIIRL